MVIYSFTHGGGSVLVGRLDFKSSLRRSDPAVGELDSHAPPPSLFNSAPLLASYMCGFAGVFYYLRVCLKVFVFIWF